jgi:signal transduction histidine kinase
LRGSLILLLTLLIAAAIAAGMLMLALFQQSATARIGQANAEIGRACDAIAASYRFYTTGWQGPVPSMEDQALRRDLTAVVQTALRDRHGVEGGIWQRQTGALAYAFPTYEGAGPKTDLPQAELPRIQEANQIALANDRPVINRYDSPSQTLLITACPLAGPMPGLTGWAMTRVFTFVGHAYQQLMAGLAILFAAVLAAAVLLARLALTWSRHVARIETALMAHDIAALPRLQATGERELDRIVNALNEAGVRLAEARERADLLSRQVAVGERLAAIGRVAAGIAHEVRNPIAAMRLRAENAIAGDSTRKTEALSHIIEQIDRVDRLVRRLLSVTQRDRPRRENVNLARFLDACGAAHAELAAGRRLAFDCTASEDQACFDPDQMRRALDNLILNAIEAAPPGSRIAIAALRRGESLLFSVRDEGPGPPASIRDHLFEPFVTGRADGTGLGLSIVREVAEAHGGTAQLGPSRSATTFEIIVPWQPC